MRDADIKYNESVRLLREIVEYVQTYENTYGAVSLKILSAMFSRRVRKIEDLSMRQYVYKHCDFFMTALSPSGGIGIMIKTDAPPLPSFVK